MTKQQSIPESQKELTQMIQNIYQRIESADILQFDSDPFLSDWDLISESDLDEGDDDQIVLECSYESDGNVFSTGVTMGELKNCFIDDNVITFSNDMGKETKLALFLRKPLIINPDLQLEDKWKVHGLNQVLSKYGASGSAAELFDLLQEAEVADLETLFKENNVLVCQTFENNSFEDVVANIYDEAWAGQNVANS